MKNLSMFCLSLHDSHLSNLKKINYIPVGLGENFFSDNWLRDNVVKIFQIKINIMENILFIIGFGKI